MKKQRKRKKHATEKKLGVTTFGKWIKAVGVSELARRAAVTPFAVHSWFYRAEEGPSRGSAPRPEMANKLIELSAGQLTLSDIFPPSHTTQE